MKGVYACDGPFFTTLRPRLPLRLAALPQRIRCRGHRCAQTAAAGSNGVPPGQASQNGASPSGPSSDDSAFEVKDKSGGSLDVRIMRGEFTDDGSTKERITRPIRKVLAKDRAGPGAHAARHMMQDCKKQPCSSRACFVRLHSSQGVSKPGPAVPSGSSARHMYDISALKIRSTKCFKILHMLQGGHCRMHLQRRDRSGAQPLPPACRRRAATLGRLWGSRCLCRFTSSSSPMARCGSWLCSSKARGA